VSITFKQVFIGLNPLECLTVLMPNPIYLLASFSRRYYNLVDFSEEKRAQDLIFF